MAVDVNPIPKFPVFTPRQAAAYARGEVDHPDKWYEGLCLHFSAWTYGFTSSGVRSAADFWRGTPGSLKSPGDHTPPVGALPCWLGGSQGFGHIAISVGYNNGVPMIASTDIRRTGKVDVVPLREVEDRWGQDYVGWAKPDFPFGPADDRRPPDVYKTNDAWGHVYEGRLTAGQKNSASVRKLQYRLRVKPTGTYNKTTAAAAAKWQRARGWENSKGERWNMTQLNKLFGANYFVHREE